MYCSGRTHGRFSQGLEEPDTAEGRVGEIGRLAENCIRNNMKLSAPLSHLGQPRNPG